MAGTDFDNDITFDMKVTINGVQADILNITSQEMTIAIPDGITDGPLVLMTGAGATTTTLPFIASPLSLQLQPTRLTIFPGQARAINAIPLGSLQGVTWSVNNIPGGNATLGTVTPGNTTTYQAPANAPSPPQVLVTAAMAANPAVQATVAVLVSDPAGGIPNIDLPPSDPADFTLDAEIGLRTSRTRLLVLLQDGAELGP